MRETVGVKYDGGKARMGIVPPFALESVAQVLTHGVQKYAVDNWKYVPDAKARYIDAALRHINEYCKGEWSDSESNLPHLSHAVCCLMFILDRELELESLENKMAQANRNQTKPLSAAMHNMIAEGVAKEKREADGWTDDAICEASLFYNRVTGQFHPRPSTYPPSRHVEAPRGTTGQPCRTTDPFAEGAPSAECGRPPGTLIQR